MCTMLYYLMGVGHEKLAACEFSLQLGMNTLHLCQLGSTLPWEGMTLIFYCSFPFTLAARLFPSHFTLI